MSDKPKLDKSVSDPMPGMHQPSPAIDLPAAPLKAGVVHIDPTDEQDIQFWAKELDVDVAGLRDALRIAGDKVEDVREHLAKG